MKTANIGELKNRLSKYLVDVKRGEEVVVRDRNRPVAKLVPFRNSEDLDAEEMELVARGAMKLPEGDGILPESFFTARLPKVRGNRAIEVILEERDED